MRDRKELNIDNISSFDQNSFSSLELLVSLTRWDLGTSKWWFLRHMLWLAKFKVSFLPKNIIENQVHDPFDLAIHRLWLTMEIEYFSYAEKKKKKLDIAREFAFGLHCRSVEALRANEDCFRHLHPVRILRRLSKEEKKKNKY